MMILRKAKDRGFTDLGWLKSYHTFSFGEYHDPQHMGFRQLRVINDDRVDPGQGFGAHPHRDMEIISYVLEGELEHKDSMGNGSVMRAGDVQVMSAGSGVTHSEFNPSAKQGVHFLQIWIFPNRKGVKPGYQQRSFGPAENGALRLIVSGDGRQGSLKIYQNADVFIGRLQSKEKTEHAFSSGRHGWIHVLRGKIDCNGCVMNEGDGAAIGNEPFAAILGRTEAEFLLFDLP